MKEVHPVLEAVREAAPKVARFRAAKADPAQFVPCLECGEPVAKEKIKTPDHLFCKEQHHRRFKAKTKAAGRDYGSIVKRAFRDLFHMARGFDYRGRDIRDDMELLPDDVALLLAKSGAMEQPRLDEYQKRDFENLKEAFARGERRELLFAGCKYFDRTFHVEKVV